MDKQAKIGLADMSETTNSGERPASRRTGGALSFAGSGIAR
jgi:hypothetical protein